jgi:formylglycine-generating enzyme required for sulfatase activity
MQDEDFAWPDVAEVIKFRNDTRKSVEDAIRSMPDPKDVAITQDSPYWSLLMGFEHERIHVETSAVLIHQLPIDALVAQPGWRTAPSYAALPASAPVNELVRVDAGISVLGKPRSFPSFGWDNEYGEREIAVPAFSASKFTVSNGEFLPFVLEGGYKEKKWWVSDSGDDEGWRWATYRNATHPSFWVATSHPDMLKFHGGKPDYPYQKDDGHARAGTGSEFRLRTMFDIIAMPWDWPVEVNYLEARAFLRWKAAKEGIRGSYRVPTEAEYHMIRGDPVPYPQATSGSKNTDGVAACLDATPAIPGAPAGKVLLPDESIATSSVAEQDARKAAISEWGKVDVIMQPSAPGNINMRWHSSTPVNMYPPSSTGFYDAHGNVWQWVEVRIPAKYAC